MLTRSNPLGRRAFTMLEMIVVIAIIAAISAIVVPRVGHSLTNAKLTAAANQIARDLEFARNAAWTQSRAITVIFHPALGTYELVGLSPIDKPGQPYYVGLVQQNGGIDSISSIFGADDIVVFDGHGRPDSGGAVTVIRGVLSRTVTVDPETGKATVQ